MDGHCLLIYESMFGNTGLVAEAVAAGLRNGGLDVDVVEAARAPRSVEGYELVVVGAPTHAMGLPRPQTRAQAAAQSGDGELRSPGPGLREWFDAVERPALAPLAAAFDTRIHVRFLPGSAAKAAARRLRRLGLRPAEPPESFWVTGSTGPLADGELDRAHRWGSAVAGRVAWERQTVPGASTRAHR